MAEKLPQNLALVGAVLAIVHLTYLTGIKTTLGFLGALAPWVVGGVLALGGIGILMSTKFGLNLGRIGFMLVGLGLLVEGLSNFGVNVLSGSMLAGIALALLVVSTVLNFSKWKVPVLSNLA